MTAPSSSPEPVDPLALSEALQILGAKEVIPAGPIQLGKAAHWYAAKWGWPVFPLRARYKTPLTQRGYLDATTDLDVIAEHWRKHPDANIGVPTGTREQGGCGYDVIDVDGQPGYASLGEIMADLPPVRAVAFTPGDPGKGRTAGRHLFIDAQGQRNATALLPGIDVRADGGFVVAAPSVALHGVSYAWLVKPGGQV